MSAADPLRPADPLDPAGLYRLGGVAALALVGLTIAQTAVFAMVPPPPDVAGWFALFQASPVRGLLAYELLMVAYVLGSIPVILALVVALRRSGVALVALYAALGFVAIVAFVEARPAFELLALARQHAAATTEAERAALLAAGHAVHAAFNGMAFQVGYFLGAGSGLLVAAAMLRSGVFSRSTALWRIASSVLDLGLFVPVVGLYLSLGSVLCLAVWHVLVARRLFALAGAPPA